MKAIYNMSSGVTYFMTSSSLEDTSTWFILASLSEEWDGSESAERDGLALRFLFAPQPPASKPNVAWLVGWGGGGLEGGTHHSEKYRQKYRGTQPPPPPGRCLSGGGRGEWSPGGEGVQGGTPPRPE